MPARNGVAGFQENFPGGEYSADEWEFIRAMAAYQKRFRRRYPAWREVLHVARCLGYRKVAAPVPVDTSVRPAEVELTAAVLAAAESQPAPPARPDAGRASD
jgi:hypothetical protein